MGCSCEPACTREVAHSFPPFPAGAGARCSVSRGGEARASAAPAAAPRRAPSSGDLERRDNTCLSAFHAPLTPLSHVLSHSSFGVFSCAVAVGVVDACKGTRSILLLRVTSSPFVLLCPVRFVGAPVVDSVTNRRFAFADATTGRLLAAAPTTGPCSLPALFQGAPGTGTTGS